MSRVRGKKRMEIIKRFLEGEEDPEFEVVPTVTDGKYFVRPRKETNAKKKQNKRDNSDNISDKHHEEDEEGSYGTPDSSGHETTETPKQTVPKAPPPKPKPFEPAHQNYHQAPYYDPTITYQILEQLKKLGEEQRSRRKKKEQKKLVKHQIQKQMARTKKKETESEEGSEGTRTHYMSPYYEYEDEHEQQEQQRQPQPQPQHNLTLTPSRRKVNLLK